MQRNLCLHRGGSNISWRGANSNRFVRRMVRPCVHGNGVVNEKLPHYVLFYYIFTQWTHCRIKDNQIMTINILKYNLWNKNHNEEKPKHGSCAIETRLKQQQCNGVLYTTIIFIQNKALPYSIGVHSVWRFMLNIIFIVLL